MTFFASKVIFTDRNKRRDKESEEAASESGSTATSYEDIIPSTMVVFTDKEIHDLKETFRLFDTNNDGK